jgi:hypothetical protein
MTCRTMPVNRHILPVVLLAGFHVPLSSQEPSWTPPHYSNQYVNSKSQVIFQSRVIFGLKASFTNLGEINYLVDSDDDEDGDTIEYVFNDGYINLTDENATFTSDFGFQMDNANIDSRGLVSSFSLNRYRTTGTEDVYSDTDSASMGWEVAYQYEWGTRMDRFRFGFIAGIGLNEFGFEVNETIDGEVYRQTAQVSLDGAEISFVENGAYTGAEGGPVINLEEDLDFDPGEEFLLVQDVWQTGEVVVSSQVNSTVELDGVLATMRFGPTFSYKPFNRFHLKGSAGLSLNYMNTDASVWESMDFLLNTGTQTSYENSNAHDWLYGFYAEGSFYYYLNERTAAYGAIQLFHTGNADPAESEGVLYEVDLQSGIVFSLGLQLSF